MLGVPTAMCVLVCTSTAGVSWRQLPDFQRGRIIAAQFATLASQALVVSPVSRRRAYRRSWKSVKPPLANTYPDMWTLASGNAIVTWEQQVNGVNQLKVGL